jgi:hypothetical protein
MFACTWKSLQIYITGKNNTLVIRTALHKSGLLTIPYYTREPAQLAPNTPHWNSTIIRQVGLIYKFFFIACHLQNLYNLTRKINSIVVKNLKRAFSFSCDGVSQKKSLGGGDLLLIVIGCQ